MAQRIDIDQIMELLPHRYPFLLVDRIIELEPGERVVGIKNVTINEPQFQGHFPGRPIMPGVLIIEALAQTGLVLALRMLEDAGNKLLLFRGVERFKFRKTVIPGDTLRLELKLRKRKGALLILEAKASVGDDVVAEGVLQAAVTDAP